MSFDARDVESSPGVGVGSRVRPGEKLLELVAPQGSKVEAFVDEAASRRLGAGRPSVFVPDTPERANLRCARSVIDAVRLAQPDQPAVVSVYGVAVLDGERHSLAVEGWRRLAALCQREAAF